MTNPPAFPNIAIVNDPSSGVTDDTLKKITVALAKQVAFDFAPVWHQGAHLKFVGEGVNPPVGWWHLVVLGNSDEAGALGYHDLTPDGLPMGKVFAATDRQYGESLSVTVSHELLEMVSDPWINLSAQSDDGKFYAWENCDAVEADGLGYQIDGIQVSDFITPAWFGHGPGKLDHLGHCTKPFEVTPGGYISIFDPANSQGWTQVQEEHTPAQLAAMGPGGHEAIHYHSIPRVGSRRERRFRGSDNWVISSYVQDAGA